MCLFCETSIFVTLRKSLFMKKSILYFYYYMKEYTSMKLKFILFCFFLGCHLLTFAQIENDTIPLRSVRTTTYQAVQKDTTWVTGAVISLIHFVKFDKQGRAWIENSLNPDGSASRKILNEYGDDGKLKEETVISFKKGLKGGIFQYEYDKLGRINKIINLDTDRNPIEVISAEYDTTGKIIKSENYYDTIPLRTYSQKFSSLRKINSKWKVEYTQYDEYANWLSCIVFNKKGQPEYIIKRDIDYVKNDNDWAKIPLRGCVKSVRQSSYIAVPKGPESIDKGRKQGTFFRYDFNDSGFKILEETYSDTGVLIDRITYEYDNNNRIIRENHKTPDDKLSTYLVWGYDKNGNLKTKSLYDAQGVLLRKGVFHFNVEGSCTRETWFKQGGKKVSEFCYGYDSYGWQREKEVLFHEEEGPEYYPVKRIWNFQGRMVEKIVDRGAFQDRYTYKYNSKGEVISGTEELNGQPIVNFIYKFNNDQQGNWKIRIKFVDDVPVVYEERQ